MKELVAQLKRHEGLRLKPYRDSEGVWTVGYGHNLNEPISWQAAEKILSDDIYKAIVESKKLPKTVRDNLNNARQRVIINMVFNMGLKRLLTFKKMLAAIELGDFKLATAEMLDSKWARQVGKRAKELAEIMREGE